MTTDPDSDNSKPETAPSKTPSKGSESIFRSERRTAPHWSLIVAALVLFCFLIYSLRDLLTPLSLSLGIFILLYPSRRTRELRPLLALIFVVFIISLWWRLSALFTPFIIAFVLAYVLNPILEWAEKRRLSRMLMSLIIIGGIAGAMIGLGFLIVPRLVLEAQELAANAPLLMQQGWDWITNSFVPWIERLNLPIADEISHLQDHMPEIWDEIAQHVGIWGSSLISGLFNLVTGLLNLILIPVLTVYFLKEFRNIRHLVYFNVVAEKHRPIALDLYRSLNKVLSAYINGQMLVCMFLAIWIGLGLWLWVGLPYAMLLGIFAGLANLVPYVGTTSAGLLTFVIALTQPDPFWTLIKTIIVFSSAQTLEGNLITPKIVGDRVGLNPLVVIFVVLLFAALFGLVGMLLAIPLTASLKEAWIARQKWKKMQPAVN